MTRKCLVLRKENNKKSSSKTQNETEEVEKMCSGNDRTECSKRLTELPVVLRERINSKIEGNEIIKV